MKPEDVHDKIILIASLNWGFGHVSRCIDLVYRLNSNNKIIIACSEVQQTIFRTYFNNLVYEQLDGYPFKFNNKGNFIKDLFLSMKVLTKHLKLENEKCDELVLKHGVNLVISDHRFGFRSIHSKSIFLTHQTNLAIPFPYSLSNLLFRRLMNKFNHIWIVDNQSLRLAGSLSKIYQQKSLYIGLLSRFNHHNDKQYVKTNTTLLLSGPEAYWEYLLDHYRNIAFDYIVGPESAKKHVTKFISSHFIASNDWENCDAVLLKSKKVYSYCGYTTLMDSLVLNCELHCIPCPGQYEQKYLAKKNAPRGIFNT